RAARLLLRGAVPAGDDHARQQPGHRLVLSHRPRVAGFARRLRGLARFGQFRRRWPATPQSGELQTRPGMSNNPAPSLVLLSAVTSLAFCALHIVVPALPLLVLAFDDSAARVQLVLTLYLAGIAAGQLVYGPLSDRFGRRPVLIAGLAVFLAGTVLCGL